MKIWWISMAVFSSLVGSVFGKDIEGGGTPLGEVRPAPTTIKVSGSDTMLQVALHFADAYHKTHANVTVSVNGAGSGTGIRSLIEGEVDIANSSRPIKDSEIARFEAKHGRAPIEHIIAYDVLAIFAHPKNPANAISIDQLRKIYGADGDEAVWSDVVKGFDEQVVRVGRSNTSGTNAFFRKAVFGAGKGFGPGIASLPGSTAVVEFVSSNPAAIGYSGIAYQNDEVKCLAITDTEGKAIAPTQANVASGAYPLRRPLYIYQGASVSPEVDRFLRWIKSEAGQKIVTAEGFTALR